MASKKGNKEAREDLGFRKTLPRLRKNKEVQALLLSDIHFCHKPPVARSNEPNWYDAMARYCDQVTIVQEHFGEPPVIIAGDVFDKWNPPPELINFVIDKLPERCYGIPGQHDLPNHSYDEIHRSAFWTLVLSGKLTEIPPDESYSIPDSKVICYPFPWGFPIKPNKHYGGGGCWTHLAVCHSYIWTDDGNGHPEASKDQRTSKYRKKLRGYDCAVFGDNHKGFLQHAGTGEGKEGARHLQRSPLLGVFRLEMFVYLIPILYFVVVVVAILGILPMKSHAILGIMGDQIESLFNHRVINRDRRRPCGIKLEHESFTVVHIIVVVSVPWLARIPFCAPIITAPIIPRCCAMIGHHLV